MIKSQHDVVIALPTNAFALPAKGLGWFTSFRRFAGFGRTYRVSKNVTDVNKDGRTVLQVSCPRGVEAIVRRANGEKITTIDAQTYSKDVKLEVAGEIVVNFREVRDGKS